MPKLLKKTEHVEIPSNVELTIKQKEVTVKGPRGELKKKFNHPKIDVYKSKASLKRDTPVVDVVVVDMWYATKRDAAVVRTVATLIQNMIIGVTKGYRYKMRVVYAHFPVNLVIADDKKSIIVQNFVGEKRARNVHMYEGVTIEKLGKDEICLEGNDVQAVSQSAANLHQANQVKNKDIRQFLDGIYVSEKCLIDA
ncbi:60S ribosomal protein L9, putative [Entamoeba invadens IP1]|uniref:60S ribosomal protein L9, putative n=1 Tax=Entamoeba invadens IP1 TaxID=370355 RepID=A0A0A1U6G4_ENTIV|nr:60S ribosomal protein L9, putative [Entamoeba invadens IP1]XP_004258149.1 60S ribosomal protein L9, putative [Entamoeba invadens IP1]ELP88465.1 60S ribosomal protein L9, putative [Entamoeba invadens IP1]ELP91378.1 60S ribosomal protein L9, putative [Entamoeba invadens IP1]|eukprot:XP_004255236.1 60S ribosomal protein L9, putative [Entamoeba invadens IP1]